MGAKEGAARRINTSQSFNGLGWILGPLIGGLFIFGSEATGEHDKFDSIVQPYMMIGGIVVIVAIVFMFIKLPEVEQKQRNGNC